MDIRMHVAPSLGVPAAVFAVFAWISMAAASEPVTFIDRVIAAYGGPASVERMAVMRQTGPVTSVMRGDAVGAVTRELDGPERLRIEIEYPDKPAEIRVLNADAGWSRGNPVSAPMHAAMRLQAAHLFVPLILMRDRDRVLDEREWNEPGGRVLRRLRLPLGEALVLVVDVDSASNLISRSSGTVAVSGQTSEFATEYADYRNWDGTVLAAREEQ